MLAARERHDRTGSTHPDHRIELTRWTAEHGRGARDGGRRGALEGARAAHVTRNPERSNFSRRKRPFASSACVSFSFTLTRISCIFASSRVSCSLSTSWAVNPASSLRRAAPATARPCRVPSAPGSDTVASRRPAALRSPDPPPDARDSTPRRNPRFPLPPPA